MTCRFCKDYTSRPLFRYAVRHYAHAECGFARFGDNFLRMIPRHEVGRIPYRALESFPSARVLALELYNNEKKEQ